MHTTTPNIKLPALVRTFVGETQAQEGPELLQLRPGKLDVPFKDAACRILDTDTSESTVGGFVGPLAKHLEYGGLIGAKVVGTGSTQAYEAQAGDRSTSGPGIPPN